VKVCSRLRVAPGYRLLDDRAAVDVLLYRADHEPDLELGHLLIAVLEDLGEIVPGIDVHDRERDALGPARLRGQVEQDAESLPPENRSAGRSNSATTSRMMWIASDASVSRWERR